MWRSMRGLNICTAALLAASMTPFMAQSTVSITEQQGQEQTQQLTASASDATAQGQTETPGNG